MNTTRNAGRQLLKAALEAGFTVTVQYESDDNMFCKGTENLAMLWYEATACDEAMISFTDNDKQSMGWAYLVHGNEGYEVISDHSAKGWVNDWCLLTEYGQNGRSV